MTRRPWFKFYPGDWLGDAGLQACSLEARGLWIQLISIMHQANPYGHLLINGKPPTNAQISQLVHSNSRAVEKLMRELEGKGVWNRNERADGTRVIYSRRMVRDNLKFNGGRDLGNSQGNATIINDAAKFAPQIPERKKKGPAKESKSRKLNPRHRWENDLLKRYGPDFYARAMDVLAADPALVDRATEAELRTPGSGVMAAMLGLRQQS